MGEYTATAEGVENGFSGSLTFDAPNESLTFTEVMITLDECMVTNCDYETLYFYEFLTDQSNELKTFEYSYREFSNGTKSLTLIDSDGNLAQYRDFPMENPSPELFQTWYLYATYVDLGDTQYYYGEDVPQMTIYEDFSFTAIDNCWELSGNFDFIGDNFYYDFSLETLNFEEACVLGGSEGFILKLLYESSYPLGCYLYEGGPTSRLDMEYGASFGHSFRNRITTLSVADQQLQEIKVFPNPAKDKISISGLQNPVEELQIYDVTGGLVKTFNAISGSTYDVSEVSPGIYFLKISSGGTTSMRKLVKR